ncbi:MAG: ADOP family duplicated permease [Vicinamibacterales bacterium]
MTPPRLPRAALEYLLPARLRDAVIGDLDELFSAESAARPWRARAAYWQRALQAACHLARLPHPRQAASRESAMTTFLKDLRQGVRLFVRQPGYAWAAAVTLALAIGANTVIFSFADVLVLKPLPIAGADRLGWILANGPNAPVNRAGVSLPEYAAYRDGVTAFSRLAAWHRDTVVLRNGAAGAERATAQVVVGDLQGVWGLKSARGRLLGDQDEGPSAPPVLVLSHRYWMTRFGGADVVGRTVLVDGRQRTVVGVVTPDIELGNLAEIDLWLPLDHEAALASRATRGWRPVGRLAPSATISTADAQVGAIGRRLAEQYPENRDWTTRVGSTREALSGGETWVVLAMLGTVVGLLLVLACANIMNLLIARLIGRRHELAVRTALGATPGRVARQIVAESLSVGLAGGVLGLAIGWAGLQGVHALASEPFFEQVAIDARVVVFALALAFVAPLAFAVAPTLRVLRQDALPTLNDASGRAVGGHRLARSRSVLVVVQVGLAVTLLVVAGLVVKSVRAVVAADLGYDPAPLATVAFDVPPWMTPDEDAALTLRRRILDEAARLPGVAAATFASELPALQFPQSTPFEIAGRTAARDRDRPTTGLTVVSPDFFQAMGIGLAAGRGFAGADRTATRAPVVVSREAVRRYWQDRPDAALGAVIQLPRPDDAAPLEAVVIGIARDLANPDLDRRPEPLLFALDDHRPTRRMYLVVRGDRPADLAGRLTGVIHAVAPDIPTEQAATGLAAVEREQGSGLLLSALFAAFAGVAVLLAATGLYGVMSYAVSQRTPEIALRMALGASAADIARGIMGRTVALAALGAGAGLAGAALLAQAMRTILYGVTATDPGIYAGAAALALVAAAVAAWMPMRRAAGIDPIVSLRQA